MLSPKQPLIVGNALAYTMCVAGAYFLQQVVTREAPERWLDYSLLACIPAFLIGLWAADWGKRLASKVKGYTAPFYLVASEKSLLGMTVLLMLASLIVSTPMLLLVGAACAGMGQMLKRLVTHERFRLNDVVAARDVLH